MRLPSRTDRHPRRVAGVLLASGLAVVGAFAADGHGRRRQAPPASPW